MSYDTDGVKEKETMSDYEARLREVRMELARTYNALFAGALVKNQVVALERRLVILLRNAPVLEPFVA